MKGNGMLLLLGVGLVGGLLLLSKKGSASTGGTSEAVQIAQAQAAAEAAKAAAAKAEAEAAKAIAQASDKEWWEVGLEKVFEAGSQFVGGLAGGTLKF